MVCSGYLRGGTNKRAIGLRVGLRLINAEPGASRYRGHAWGGLARQGLHGVHAPTPNLADPSCNPTPTPNHAEPCGGQVVQAQRLLRETGESVTNVVFMGMGEVGT